MAIKKPKRRRSVLDSQRQARAAAGINTYSTTAIAPTSALATPTLVALENIVLDGAAQPRLEMLSDVAASYAERMAQDPETGQVTDPEGQVWPSVIVFRQGGLLGEGPYYVADGFHRVTAAMSVEGISRIQCEVRDGALRDAIAYSLGANARHGQRRTNADKRRAVERALEDDEFRTRSNSWLSSMCAVSKNFVGVVRTELEQSARIPFEAILYSEKGAEYERIEELATSTPASTPLTRESSPSSPKTPETPEEAGSVLIAYPTGAREFKDLVGLIASRKVRPQRIICAQPSGQSHYWEAAQSLASLDYESVASVCIEQHQRVYWVLSRTQTQALPMVVASHEALLETNATLEMVGIQLDTWRH